MSLPSTSPAMATLSFPSDLTSSTSDQVNGNVQTPSSFVHQEPSFLSRNLFSGSALNLSNNNNKSPTALDQEEEELNSLLQEAISQK